MIKITHKYQIASPVGKTIEIYLSTHDQTTVVRNNHKFTLNKLLGGSIYLEAFLKYKWWI